MLNQTMVHHILHLAFYFTLQLGQVPVWPDEHRLSAGDQGNLMAREGGSDVGSENKS